MEKETYTYQKESGPRAGLVNFIGNLAVNKSLTKEEKKVIYKAMHRNIADMESDGVYFDNSFKEIVESQIDTLGKDEQKAVSESKKTPSK